MTFTHLARHLPYLSDFSLLVGSVLTNHFHLIILFQIVVESPALNCLATFDFYEASPSVLFPTMSHLVDESNLDEVQEVQMDLEEASQVLEERKAEEARLREEALLREEARLREEALNSAGVDLSRARPTSRSGASRSGASLPPPAHAASSVSSVSHVSLSAAAAAASALAAASGGSGQAINPCLLELVCEQQQLMGQVETRRAQVLPAPQFQVFAQQGPGPSKPTPVNTSPSLMLGAQMKNQLHLDSTQTLDRVDVLTANQMAMQANQLGMLRKQQMVAAEAKVGFSILEKCSFCSVLVPRFV